MNIIKNVQRHYAAYETNKHRLLYAEESAPDLKMALYVTSILSDYNRDAVRLLHKKKYGIYWSSDKGFIWYSRANLDVGLLKTDAVIERLQRQIREREMTMLHEQKKIRDQRMECQQNEKPHLVQKCNNDEDKLLTQYAKDVLVLSNAIIKVINRQIQSLTEAENLLTIRLEACTEQVHQFYALLCRYDNRERMRLPNLTELQKIVPLHTFPEDLRTYKKNLKQIRDNYQDIAKKLKAQIGI